MPHRGSSGKLGLPLCSVWFVGPETVQKFVVLPELVS